MGAVGADRELELEEELIGGDVLAVARVAVLAPDLAELARPVGEEQGSALVHERGIVRALRTVESDAREPALRELVLPGDVRAEGAGPGAAPQVAPAPHPPGAGDQPPVDRPAER